MTFIKCSRDALLKPLQTVGSIIEGRQTLPILSNILIKKEGSIINFSATDLEIQVRTSAQIGEGDDDLEVTLPAAKFSTLLGAIPGNGTEVSLELNNSKLILRANSGRYTLSTQPAEEYPELPAGEMPTVFELPAAKVKHLIQMVYFSMAQQDIRYYLNGLLLIADNGFVRAVATDGHRLAYCDVDSNTQFEEKIEAILPRKTVLQLLKLLPDNDEVMVKIELGETQARFTFGQISFLTKLVDGKFPDYQRVIPTNNDKQFTVNREQLIGALKRAAILANEKFKGLRWVISPGLLRIQSANSDMEEAFEEIVIDYQQDEVDFGFNVSYLLDVLGNLKNADILFTFANSQGATIIKMPESEQFFYVLMPMRI